MLHVTYVITKVTHFDVAHHLCVVKAVTYTNLIGDIL